MLKNGPIALLFNFLVIVFVMAPLVIVCLVAFTPAATLSVPTTDWSMRWIYAVFEHGDFVQSFKNSLWLATYAASLAAILAIPAAIVITRYEFRGRDALHALFLSPLMIPNLVLGVALLRFFALMGFTGSFAWLVLSHVIVVTPYVIRLIMGSLIGFDRSIEHAAYSLGASRAVVFFKVNLPLILPGVSGGWLLAFINSFDETTMSVFITSPSTITLPVRMYMYATESIDPLMAAVSALVIALTAVAMFVLDKVYGLDRILIGER